jgi:hypothetical protein
MGRLSLKNLLGWKGWGPYIKSFSTKSCKQESEKNREEKLLLYFTLQRLIRDSSTTFGSKESKQTEFRFYFKEAKQLRLPQDIEYFIKIIEVIKQKLETGEYPPFPRLFASILSERYEHDYICFRKYIWNIDKDDIILEPGQDPLRQPFIEPRQFSSDMIASQNYFKHLDKGKIFPEEEFLLESKKDIA